MPLYDLKCSSCNAVEERYISLSDLDNDQSCIKCGADMNRIIGRDVNVAGDLEPYVEYNLGHEPVYIKSRRHLDDICKKEGVYPKSGKDWY